MLDTIQNKPEYKEPIEKIFPLELQSYPQTGLDDDPITVLHFHSVYELGVCCSGHGRCVFADSYADFEEGDITLFSPYETHYSRSDSGIESNWIFFYFDLDATFSSNGFSPDYWRLLCNDIDKQYPLISRKQYPHLCDLAEKIIEAANNSSPYRKTEVSLLIAQFLIAISKDIQIYKSPDQFNNVDLMSRLLPSIHYIRQHYHEALYIDDLAKLCNMSVTSFRRNFHAAFGTSPTDYILSVRMRIATHYLCNSTMSISDVAVTCGIPDTTNFIRYFSKRFNTTPKKYRDQHKNQYDIQ